MQLSVTAANVVCDAFTIGLDDGYLLFHTSGDAEVAKPRFNDPGFLSRGWGHEHGFNRRGHQHDCRNDRPCSYHG